MLRGLEFSLAVLVAVVAVVAGGFGFIFLFSDPTTDVSERVFWYVVHFFIPGLLIGAIFPRGWYMAGVIAWPSVVFGVGNLLFSALRLIGLAA